MDLLIVANTALSGALFVLWNKNTLLDFSIKIGLLAILVCNVLRLAGKL
jgi:hypothetical protein